MSKEGFRGQTGAVRGERKSSDSVKNVGRPIGREEGRLGFHSGEQGESGKEQSNLPTKEIFLAGKEPSKTFKNQLTVKRAKPLYPLFKKGCETF